MVSLQLGAPNGAKGEEGAATGTEVLEERLLLVSPNGSAGCGATDVQLDILPLLTVCPRGRDYGHHVHPETGR